MRKAGFGSRVINFLIDTILIFIITYGTYNWWIFQVMYFHFTYLPFYEIFAIIIFVYYVFFEGIFRRTPGKWLSLSKVANKEGKRASILQIIIRSLVRITLIDCFFIPFLDKPLHDYLSKTEVIEA